MRVNWAVTMVFLTLEITEILLAIGFFRVGNGASAYASTSAAGQAS